MYCIYVLKSHKNGKRYVGFTSSLPQERLKQHNYGSNKWSKHNGPFELIYTESCSDKTEARRRELFLKSGAGRQFLDKILIS